jgi:DNA-binding transcriptional regulator YhcF (GntR family)
MADGWISIHRSITENWIWEEKPFDRGRAWIDLLMMVNHTDTKIMFDGSLVEVKRGQRITSIRKLSERWGWSTTKTTKFLTMLEDEQMITLKKDTKKTLVTIVKYSVYQDSENKKVTQKIHRSNAEVTQKNTNNNDNTENNDDNDILSNWNPVNVCDEVKNLFNSIAVDLPKVKALSEARKKAINARVKEHGIDLVRDAFIMAQESDFLSGRGGDKWKASFDWIMNPNNFIKVIEGNYNNNGNGKKENKDDDFFKTLGGTMYEQAGNSEIDHNNQGFLSLEFNGNE